MAIRNYDIGGMLARSGQAQGQQMAQGVSAFGEGLGNMLTGVSTGLEARRERKDAESASEQYRQILDTYQTDPVGMMRQAQKAKMDPDKNIQQMGDMLMEEAKRLTQARTAQTAALETAGQDVQREAQRKRAMQVATQDQDQNALVALRAGALDPVEYLSGRVTSGGVETLQGTPGTQFLRREPETGKLAVEATVPFKPEPKEVESLSVSALKDIATPESIIEYINTGDENVLVPLTEDKPDEGATRSKLLATDNVLNTVKEASGLTGEVYPLFYDVTKFLPTTDARQLSGRVETLKSTLSFDRLQQMRDESKTGGALGNVSNIEIGLLGANLAALDPAAGDFAQQLKKVETHYTNFKRALLGQKPLGDRYVVDKGILFYVDDNDDYVSLGKL